MATIEISIDQRPVLINYDEVTNGNLEYSVKSVYTIVATGVNYLSTEIKTFRGSGDVYFLTKDIAKVNISETSTSTSQDYQNNLDATIVSNIIGVYDDSIKTTLNGNYSEFERKNNAINTNYPEELRIKQFRKITNKHLLGDAVYTFDHCTEYLKFNGVTLIENCAVVAADTGCPCPDIQNMINAANKELYDAFVQWNGNRRTAKIELVKTLTETMSKGNKDKFDKLSKEISDLKDKIWGG